MIAFRTLLAAVAVGILVLPAYAQEPTKDDIEKAAMRAEALNDLAFASELALLGRGDAATGVKSPESLVIAAGLLRRANGAFGGKTESLGVAPTDKDGKPVKGEAVKSPDLATQVESLFEEARGMVAGDKARAAAIEALIKDVKGWPTRGGVGGPKTITRVLNPGETHTYPLKFFGGQPAAISMTSSGPPKIQFDLVHIGGASLLNTTAYNTNHNWTPARDKDAVKNYKLTLTNVGRKPTTYTLSAN